MRSHHENDQSTGDASDDDDKGHRIMRALIERDTVDKLAKEASPDGQCSTPSPGKRQRMCD